MPGELRESTMSSPNEPIVVRGTRILATDPPCIRLPKFARITLDAMGQFVGLLDAEGTVLEINRVALEAAGITLADIDGKPFWTIFRWQESPKVNAELRAMIARAARGELVRWNTELPGNAGRETIIMDMSLTPVRDDTGNVVYICVEARDIAGEADARPVALGQDEAELLRTIERIGSSIASETDIHRIVQTVTDEATQLVGAQFGAFFYNVLDDEGESFTLYTLSGVPREAFASFPMPRNTAVFEPTFRGTSVVRSGDITRDERYGRNAPHYGMPAGHLPVRSYLAVPVVSRGKEVLGGLFFGHERPDVFTDRHERLVVGVAGWAAVAMDNARLYDEQVRARAQLERALAAAHEARADAERANHVKSRFLATVSHELRTPLTAIQGYVQLLELGVHGPLTTEQRETLSRVQRSQHALQTLIDDVLNFARLEAGRVEYRIEAVNVRDVVTAVLQMLEPQLAAKGLSSRVEIPPALEVAADPDKLRQILLNLISNATKFTDSGGSVSVDAPRSGELPAAMVAIRVADTGRGIPRARQKDIFDPFVQVHRLDATPAGGIGLGLAISRDLARGMDGDLRVRGDEGSGSAFTLTLPAA